MSAVNKPGAKFLTLSATRMGINIMRESILIIPDRGIATDCPKRILINVGSVKGIRREVTTTMTMTRGLFAFTRFDMNGVRWRNNCKDIIDCHGKNNDFQKSQTNDHTGRVSKRGPDFRYLN